MLETHARFLSSAVTYVHQGTALISLLQGGHKAQCAEIVGHKSTFQCTQTVTFAFIVFHVFDVCV